MFQAGEIVLAAFPFSALTGVKRRSCLVLAAADTTDDFVVAFITSAPASASLPFATAISPNHQAWPQTGLKTASVIRADKLVTLNDAVISGGIRVLPYDTLTSVRSKLKGLLQTPEVALAGKRTQH